MAFPTPCGKTRRRGPRNDDITSSGSTLSAVRAPNTRRSSSLRRPSSTIFGCRRMPSESVRARISAKAASAIGTVREIVPLDALRPSAHRGPLSCKLGDYQGHVGLADCRRGRRVARTIERILERISHSPELICYASGYDTPGGVATICMLV